MRRGPVTVTWVPVVDGLPPRIAYAVGRKAGGAVIRNRIRRRLKAVVWETRFLLDPGAYLVGGTARVATMSYQELRSAIWEVLEALGAVPPGSRPPAEAS